MSRGIGRTGQKHKKHYEFKRRCQEEGCKKRAIHYDAYENKYYCKKHIK